MKNPELGLVALLVLCGLTGCAGDERHDQLVNEVNRLRAETYQRTYEAAALRQMLDRVTVELRTREPVNLELLRRYGELAVAFGEVTRRCAAPIAPEPEIRRRADVPVPDRAPTSDPGRARQIDDRLFDDRR